MYLNKQWADSIHNSGYGKITAYCLNSHFVPLFLLTCICSRNWFFFSLWPFLPLGLHLCLHVSGCLEGLSRQRVVSGYRSVVSVESVRLGPMGTMDTFYWKQASGTPEWCRDTPLTPHCLYVRESECLLPFTICGKRPVPFHYLLSHSPTLPLSVFKRFVQAILIDCLFISGPAAASAPEDEIVMVIVIFCEGDKEGESHKQEIGFGSYRRQDQDMVNTMCFSAHLQQYSNKLNLLVWKVQQNMDNFWPSNTAV